MTEPVAYLNKYLDHSTNITRYKPENQRLLSSTPLYTAEQLHPRVKMTHAEFDEWFDLYYKNSFLTPLNFLKLISNIENGYPLIYNIYLKGREKQLELLELWLWFKQERPEETIDIVPDMKWFVVSKKSEHVSHYNYLNKTSVRCEDVIPQYSPNKGVGAFFDTKEEAEKWTNPLTEAVQLPVEGE